MSPALNDRYRRADDISNEVRAELLRDNKVLVERIIHQIREVIYESDVLEKLTPAAVGRFSRACSEWDGAVGRARVRAEREAAGHDLWIGRYWRALSANHKGLRRRRAPHLDEWHPVPVRDKFDTRWDDPYELLVQAGVNRAELDRVRQIVSAYGQEEPGDPRK